MGGKEMNSIEIRNLTKIFDQKQALSGLDMTVPEGSIYGFIGIYSKEMKTYVHMKTCT